VFLKKIRSTLSHSYANTKANLKSQVESKIYHACLTL